jgi:hypothetical protein
LERRQAGVKRRKLASEGGVIIMALALALVFAAVVVRVTVGSEPTSGTERLVDYWQQY